MAFESHRGGLTAGFLGPGPISIDAVVAPWLISPSLYLLTLIVCLAIALLGLLTRGPVKQEANIGKSKKAVG